MQVRNWDIAATFSAMRPARRQVAAAAREPAAGFQALLEAAPSLPSSPFTLQCGKTHTRSLYLHQQCQLQLPTVALKVELMPCGVPQLHFDCVRSSRCSKAVSSATVVCCCGDEGVKQTPLLQQILLEVMHFTQPIQAWTFNRDSHFADEDWQSPSASTPQLRPSKPPRITPPPFCNLQAETECRPSAPHASADGPPDASMSPDADIASPGGRCEPGSHPIPSCSPEVMCCHFKLELSPHAKALDQANLCISAESQHECLPPAMSSTTPTLLHVSPHCRYARCMQSSEDQSRVRPFPDLSFDTEASQEAVASDTSQVPVITR